MSSAIFSMVIFFLLCTIPWRASLRTCWNLSASSESVHCLGYLYFVSPHLYQDAKAEMLNTHLFFHQILYLFCHYFTWGGQAFCLFVCIDLPPIYLHIFNVSATVALLQSFGISHYLPLVLLMPKSIRSNSRPEELHSLFFHNSWMQIMHIVLCNSIPRNVLYHHLIYLLTWPQFIIFMWCGNIIFVPPNINQNSLVLLHFLHCYQQIYHFLWLTGLLW